MTAAVALRIEIVAVVRILAGLLHAEAGSIELEGGDPERSVGEHAHHLGHRDPFKPALTVRENLEFWQQFLGGQRKWHTHLWNVLMFQAWQAHWRQVRAGVTGA